MSGSLNLFSSSTSTHELTNPSWNVGGSKEDKIIWLNLTKMAPYHHIVETGNNLNTFDLKNRNSAETQFIALNFTHHIAWHVLYTEKKIKSRNTKCGDVTIELLAFIILAYKYKIRFILNGSWRETAVPNLFLMRKPRPWPTNIRWSRSVLILKGDRGEKKWNLILVMYV